MIGKSRFLSLACYLMVLLCAVVLPAYGDNDTTRACWQVKTSDDAVSSALAHTGFSKLEYSLDKVKSGVVTLTDDETPFLHDSINGHEFWQVNIDSVHLMIDVELKSGEIVQRVDTNLRNFTIFLHPKTGQIVRISSEPDDYPHKPPKPSAEQAEKQLQSLGPKSEKYHGFPDVQPKVIFLEALRSVINDPFTAHEIHGWYVMHSRGDGTPRPVWIIDLRGLDPPPPAISQLGANVSIENRNHRRNGVDAMTGAHLFTTTLPQGGVMRDTVSQEDERLNDEKP
jgi:hypothetical protein